LTWFFYWLILPSPQTMGNQLGMLHGNTEARKALPEEVKRLGWVSFFTDVASEMVYPVVPLFLTSVLGAAVAVLGAIEGLAEVIVSIMKGVSGWHCDKMGRRVPYIRWGYGLGALAKPLMALAFSWSMILAARAVDRVGKGLRTTAKGRPDRRCSACIPGRPGLRVPSHDGHGWGHDRRFFGDNSPVPASRPLSDHLPHRHIARPCRSLVNIPLARGSHNYVLRPIITP
jgi:hypothetical protein